MGRKRAVRLERQLRETAAQAREFEDEMLQACQVSAYVTLPALAGTKGPEKCSEGVPKSMR